jgi:phage gp36-like protein
MGYSTFTSILANNADLPQTSTVAGYTATVAIISRHITRADALIDAKLSRRYPLPFAVTPPLIATISEDIASFYTYRSLYASDNQNTSARITEYSGDGTMTAFSLLEQIREGTMDLVYSDGSIVTERTDEQDDSVYSTNEEYTPIFDVDGPLSWEVSRTRESDMAEGRC